MFRDGQPIFRFGNTKSWLESMQLCKDRLAARSRPPAPGQLAQSLKSLFKHQVEKSGSVPPLTDVQLGVIIPTFRYLSRLGLDTKEVDITIEDLKIALQALRRGSSPRHLQLATLLFQEFLQRQGGAPKTNGDKLAWEQTLATYVEIACANGDVKFARDLLEGDEDASRRNLSSLAKGYVRERQDGQLQDLFDSILEGDTISRNTICTTAVLAYGVEANGIAMAKKWYSRAMADPEYSNGSLDAAMLNLCTKYGDHQLGNTLSKRLIAQNDGEGMTRNALLRWYVASGRDLGRVGEFVAYDLNRHDTEKTSLDMDNLNEMLDVSLLKGQRGGEQSLLDMAQSWDLEPNASTHALLLKQRVKEYDYASALELFAKLSDETLLGKREIASIHRLLLALCDEAEPNYRAIMEIVDNLRERKVDFDAHTLSALALLHIQREEVDDLTDLLTTFVPSLTTAQRNFALTTFMPIIMSPKTDDDVAWKLYAALQSTMRTSMNRDTRLRIMASFFDRDRGEVALKVFGDMRKDADPALQPRLDDYCVCLEGLARFGDYNCVQLVANMFTMDDVLDPNTKFYNALMLGYNGADKAHFTPRTWDKIMFSRQGPNRRTFPIALKACEDLGEVTEEWLDEIVAKMRQMFPKLPREMFAAYLGAVAGKGHDEKTWTLLETAEEETGVGVDALLLGKFHNARPGDRDGWMAEAKKRYPQACAELAKCNLMKRQWYHPNAPADHPDAVIKSVIFYDIAHLGPEPRP